jgi:hypothetical protein
MPTREQRLGHLREMRADGGEGLIEPALDGVG